MERDSANSTSCCCGGDPECGDSGRLQEKHYHDGALSTPAGTVSRVKTELSFRDRFGHCLVRLGIGRMSYRVEPGLTAVGSPGSDSPVFVTANYKISFDRLREALSGRDAWILVLDTNGINVWCAAGKGSFGTEELVRRISRTRLEDIVSHRRLVLPQLGAAGVSAHRVRRVSGWKVRWGPVRSTDLASFLDAGMKAPLEMRRVRFPLADRLVLVPLELVQSGKYVLPAAVLLLLLSGLSSDGFSVARVGSAGLVSSGLLAVAWIAGAVVSPALLPWIPARAFSLKGALVGFAAVLALLGLDASGIRVFAGPWEIAGWFLIVPTVSSVLAMNFTGASTFTSLSGVKKEMRFAVPVQVTAGIIGFGLWIAGRFVQ